MGTIWAMEMVSDDCHVREWYGNGMGMVWDLKSVPYKTRGGNSPIPIPYQSIPAPQVMEKLWDYNGKDNLYP